MFHFFCFLLLNYYHSVKLSFSCIQNLFIVLVFYCGNFVVKPDFGLSIVSILRFLSHFSYITIITCVVLSFVWFKIGFLGLDTISRLKKIWEHNFPEENIDLKREKMMLTCLKVLWVDHGKESIAKLVNLLPVLTESEFNVSCILIIQKSKSKAKNKGRKSRIG